MTAGRKNVTVPAIGELPPSVDPAVRDVLQALINAHNIREGHTAKGSNSRQVTIQDLVNAGVVPDGKII